MKMTPDNANTLQLPRPLVNQILAHAQKHPDTEVCGLIGSDEADSMSYYPVENIAAEPGCRFEMDASQQIGAMKKMREDGQRLLAIVHSHPSTEAIPSQLDMEKNRYHDVFYIIISLNTRGVLQMRAFILGSQAMREVELLLEEET